jgi:hypothetical protein
MRNARTKKTFMICVERSWRCFKQRSYHYDGVKSYNNDLDNWSIFVCRWVTTIVGRCVMRLDHSFTRTNTMFVAVRPDNHVCYPSLCPANSLPSGHCLAGSYSCMPITCVYRCVYYARCYASCWVEHAVCGVTDMGKLHVNVLSVYSTHPFNSTTRSGAYTLLIL